MDARSKLNAWLSRWIFKSTFNDDVDESETGDCIKWCLFQRELISKLAFLSSVQVSL